MVRTATQHESRFDSIVDAQELDLLDAATAVLLRELFRRSSGRFEDAEVEHELSCRGRAGRVDIDHCLRGRFDGGLAGALRTCAHDDPLLGGTETDDRGGRDAEGKRDGQDGLAAVISYGVHSTRRAAAPSMIKRGRPTNPSGTGIA